MKLHIKFPLNTVKLNTAAVVYLVHDHVHDCSNISIDN